MLKIVKIKNDDLNLINNPLQDSLFTYGENLAVSGLKDGLTLEVEYYNYGLLPKIADEILKIINQQSNINKRFK